jgi:hypothetical protein
MRKIGRNLIIVLVAFGLLICWLSWDKTAAPPDFTVRDYIIMSIVGAQAAYMMPSELSLEKVGSLYEEAEEKADRIMARSAKLRMEFDK